MTSDTPTGFEIDTTIVTFATVAIAACITGTAFLLGRLRRGLPLIPARSSKPVPWEGSDVLVIVLGFGLLASGVGTLIGPEPPIDVALAANLVLVATASIFAVAWLIARGATLVDLGLAPVRFREDIALAVVGLSAVLAPILLLNAWLTTIKPYEHPVIQLLTTHRDAWGVSLVLGTACVTAPIGEELFFRRILQGWLEKIMPSFDGLPAIVIASLAFAGAHYGQGLAYIPLFPLGVALGLLARRTGSIVPSILLHALFNAVSVALLLAGPTND